MLVLSRKPEQTIKVQVDVPELLEYLGLPVSAELRRRSAEVGDVFPLQLTVMKVRGRVVRLGFTAPRCFRLCREELLNERAVA